MTNKKLMEEFAPVSGADWRAKIEADLKGADFDKKLVWKTDEGFSIQPYYRQEDLDNLALRNPGLDQALFFKNKETIDNDWLIRQDFKAAESPEECNCDIKAAITRGIQSVGIDLAKTKTISPDFLESILKEIDLENIEINFSNAASPTDLFSSFSEYVNKSGFDKTLIRGSLGIDPIGQLNISGNFKEDHLNDLADILNQSSSSFPKLKLITVDAASLQDGGSSLSQELGFGLAMANSYLGELTKRGIAVQSILSHISFSFASGPNYFMEIAKLRAARWLWKSICQEWSPDAENHMHIHSRSANWNLTLYDPYVNMLRTSTEAMSSSLGGSDSISVLTFDSAYRDENLFSSRIARNTQIILKEESHFDKVADPAAGSYYIEQLTESIAEQAWKHFVEVEEKNGYLVAFKSGWIQEQVLASADIKAKNAASRRQTILGVNQYPNFSELVLNQDFTKTEKPAGKESEFTPIKSFRIAEELESLRLQTEKRGKRPKVFLLKYGDAVWMTARAMFAGNFFACAGYEILDNAGFKTIEAGINAARKAKADIVVLCSSDDEYKTIAPEVHKALNGNSIIVIAGFPTASVEELKSMGIEHFIHVKSNLLEELGKINKILSI